MVACIVREWFVFEPDDSEVIMVMSVASGHRGGKKNVCARGIIALHDDVLFW